MSSQKLINIVLASTKAHGIGLNNTLPWRLKQELKHFKNITTSYNPTESNRQNAIVMGRKTWDSLSTRAPLPNRKNIVLTTQKASNLTSKISKDAQKNLQVLGSLPEMFDYIEGEKEFFLSGRIISEKK